MKANPERIRLLVDELRSTDKKQGTRALRRKVNGVFEYCCLGVATELAMRHGLAVAIHENDNYRYYDGAEIDLPRSVSDWYGFVDENDDEDVEDPTLIFYDVGFLVNRTAIDANDRVGLTFSQIGDAFERTYLETES